MVKEIICSGGEAIQVDDSDYELLSRHKWHFSPDGAKNRYYAVTRLNTNLTKNVRTIFMHTLIMGFGFNYDHIDNNTKNNQKSNLRKATWSENGWNKGKPKGTGSRNCTSQYKGVSKWINSKGETLWNVGFKVTSKGVKPEIYVRKNGFKTEIDAARFYNEEIVKHRGAYAWVNPIPNKSLEEK